MQLPVPEHAPPQPAKVEVESADSDNVTEVPELKLVEQVEPQLMPEGFEVTVPVPVPGFVMPSEKLGIWLTVSENDVDFALTPVDAPATETVVVVTAAEVVAA